MPLFLLLLLLLMFALGMAGLAQATDQDVYRVLAIASAGVCLVWICAIVHWSVQLLALVALLWSSHHWTGARPWRWRMSPHFAKSTPRK